METKVCNKCKRELPLSEFSKCRTNPDGLQRYCKDCSNKLNKEYYARRAAAKTERTANSKHDPNYYCDERFKGITPRELIEELRNRGYTGTLEFK